MTMRVAIVVDALYFSSDTKMRTIGFSSGDAKLSARRE